MTDRAQFEAMLEALINEDQETAKEIFHNIVVGKSREIYEELLESDFQLGEEGEEVAAPVEEEAEEEVAEEDEEESDDEVGADDEEGEESPFGDEEGEEEGDGDIEDRVMDLEDALDELKAEFEQLMGGEEGGDEFGGEPEMGGDEFGGEPAFGGDEEEEMEQMFEYVNKVSLPKHGDNGVNVKSTVAGKNDMGGTTANIAKGGEAGKGGTQGGLLKPSTTLQDGGNMNKPGANAGKTAFKKKESAKHGDNGDRGADSVINGVKSRAK